MAMMVTLNKETTEAKLDILALLTSRATMTTMAYNKFSMVTVTTKATSGCNSQRGHADHASNVSARHILSYFEARYFDNRQFLQIKTRMTMVVTAGCNGEGPSLITGCYIGHE